MQSSVKLNDSLIEKQRTWYRSFHKHPELSMKEFKTTQKIKEILREIDIEIIHSTGEVGVLAIIEGNEPGPEVVLRADIDALPIQEQSNLPFRSEVNGVSHMCGHDFHTSVLLAAAAYFKETSAKWNGRVKLLFQPGEETTQGAKYMMEQGALSGKEKAIFGLHNAPQLPAGTIGVRKGPFFASADTLHIKIFGKKGHAALPHLTTDATVAASAVVMGLQTAVSRNVNPFQPAVITIGSLHSGQGHNVISDLAELWGTIRTFSEQTRQELYQIVPRIIHQIAEGYGAKAEVNILPQTPAVNNDPDLVDQFKQAATRVVPEEKIVEAEQIMAAEDFAIYQEYVPGCYFLVGTRDEGKGITEAWHDPHFKVNESVMPLASALIIEATLEQLKSV